MISGRFTDLATQEKHQLEQQLKHLNRELMAVNEKISALQAQRDSLRLRMGRVVRQLHEIRCSKIKQAHSNFERVDNI
jgi:predicted  nucleic acid-binding Zn-ribbon protein